MSGELAVAYRVVKLEGKPPTMEAVTVPYQEWVKLVLDGWVGTQEAAFDLYMQRKAEEL